MRKLILALILILTVIAVTPVNAFDNTSGSSISNSEGAGEPAPPEDGPVSTSGASIAADEPPSDGGGEEISLSVSWGEMNFNYIQPAVWNIETYRYEYPDGTWPEENFTAGNNKITVENLSAADVNINIRVSGEVFGGIDMGIYTEDAGLSAESAEIYLPGCLQDEAIPRADAFVNVSGALSDEEITAFKENGFTRIGEIIVSVEQ